jgi:hypothetical protein
MTSAPQTQKSQIENEDEVKQYLSRSKSISNKKFCDQCHRELYLDDFKFIVIKQQYSSTCKWCNGDRTPAHVQGAKEELEVLRSVQVEKHHHVITPPEPGDFQSTKELSALPPGWEDMVQWREAISLKLASLTRRNEDLENRLVKFEEKLEGLKGERAKDLMAITQERGTQLLNMIRDSPGQEKGILQNEARKRLGLNKRQMDYLLSAMRHKIIIKKSKLDRRHNRLVLVNKNS